ncbi:MAG: hypothetical protein EBR82_80920 [Caulobacteraceae bacterium]|nr:hypothetical protein [Caulobacteraceae bacterium]
MTDENDKLSFLDQPRDDNGKFASRSEQPAPVEAPAPPVSAAPEPVAPPVVEPVAPVQVPPGYIPTAALLDEREKRQKYERELEDFKRKYEEATRKPPEPMDPLADPEGFERQLNERLGKAEWDAITRISLGFAVKAHGADTVKAAEDWVREQASTRPGFVDEIRQSTDPYDFVVRAHKRHMAMSKIGDEDPDSWAAKWAEQNGYVKAGQANLAAASGQTPSPTIAAPPRPSLASAPSAGNNSPKVPMGPGAAFDGLFK